MRVFVDAWNRSDLPSGTVATVGNFDGIHRGQQEIVRQVVERAATDALTPIVVTFEPHPLQVLRPEQAPPRLTTLEQKEALLRDRGVEALVVVSFDQPFSQTPARRFVEELLFDRLDVRALFIGSKFVFGRDREGNLALLEELARPARRVVLGVDEILEGGEPISSTRIRAAVSRGDVREAAHLLGRPYSVAGSVVHGDALGRKMGWPTMNLETENELLPAFGVYRSLVTVSGEGPYEAVTNVGVRPTMHVDEGPILESHILDFKESIYGCKVKVEMLDRLRGERRFASAQELREQIGRDVVEARRRFAADRAS